MTGSFMIFAVNPALSLVFNGNNYLFEYTVLFRPQLTPRGGTTQAFPAFANENGELHEATRRCR
jgi:hypothetical protein